MTLKELIEQHKEDLQDLDYQQIAEYFNKQKAIPNPVPITQVKKPVKTVYEYKEVLSEDDFQLILTKGVALFSSGRLLGEALGFNYTLTDPAVTLSLLSSIGVSELGIDALMSKYSETVDDPEYQDTILDASIATKNGLGYIKPDQVQDALN